MQLAKLKARIDIVDLVARYVRLKRRGHELWGCCPFHADRTPSFRLDTNRQDWRCFGCNTSGDAIDFIAAIEGLDLAGAAQQLRGLVGSDPGPVRVRHLPQPGHELATARNRETAQEAWRSVRPLDADDDHLPGRIYLTGRGFSSWPETLRFHPACPFLDSVGDGRLLRRAPAILAPVNCHQTGYVVGIWRIRLTVSGEKIERRGLGPTKANASRLFWADGDELAIAEGVEDALAVHALTGLPCWAALNAGNMARLVIPRRFSKVTLFADADDVGRRAAHELADRLREDGRRAAVLRAIDSKDPNERLLTLVGAA